MAKEKRRTEISIKRSKLSAGGNNSPSKRSLISDEKSNMSKYLK